MQYTADINSVDGSPCIMAGRKVYASFESERERDTVLRFLNGRKGAKGDRKTKEPEEGSAGMVVTLSNSTVEVCHTEGGACLFRSKVTKGYWEDLWHAIKHSEHVSRRKAPRQPRGGPEEVTTDRLAEAIRCSLNGIPYTYTGEDEALPLSFDSDDVTGSMELIAVIHHWHGGAEGERIAVATEGDWRNDDETATSTSIINVRGALYTVRHNANMAIERVECLGMLMNDGHNTPNTSATTYTKKEADQ